MSAPVTAQKSPEVIAEELKGFDDHSLLREVERRRIAVCAEDHAKVSARVDWLEGLVAEEANDKRDLARVAEHVAAGEVDEALQLLHDHNPQDVPLPYLLKRRIADRQAEGRAHV